MRKFTESHEWVELKGSKATVGITQHALREIGEVVFVELPKVAKSVRAGEEVVVLESTKAAVEITSPLTGEITAVNSKLVDALHIFNSDPEEKGWLFELELVDLDEASKLLDKKLYEETIVGLS